MIRLRLILVLRLKVIGLLANLMRVLLIKKTDIGFKLEENFMLKNEENFLIVNNNKI